MLPARRHEISRLEAFSDAVFAFALTLLVVSLDVPTSYDDLVKLIAGFVPFAASFALLSWIWYEHNIFFRRYGLQDPWTVALNAALLFVVLFYVYHFLMGPAHWLYGTRAVRRRKALEARLAAAATPEPA